MAKDHGPAARYEPRRSRQRSTANIDGLIFAAIFVIISVATTWIGVAFGQIGVLALAAVVGATDIDPFVINIAQGGVTGLSVTTLSAAILIAASSNNIAKAIYALGLGGVES